MYQIVTETDFIAAFEGIRPDNFSRPALIELFEHLQEMEDEIGQQHQLDVIGLCCDWSEMTLEELKQSYPDLIHTNEDNPVAGLQDETMVLEVEHWGGEQATTYVVLNI